MNTTDNKIVEITYNGFNFTVDFTKKGVPSIYYNGKLLKPTLNKKLNRSHVTLSLPLELMGRPGLYICANGYECLYHIYTYRLIAAAMEKRRTGEFDYEKFKDLQVDHIDGNSSNDTPSNLRWTTRKRNNSRKMARKRKSLHSKTTSHRNEIIRATKDGQEILFKNGMVASRELGCSHVLIYRCLNPEDYATTAKGWKLEWVPFTYGVLENVQ